MTKPLSNKQIDQWITDYLASELSEQDRPAFEAWLHASPEHPRRVARLAATDYALREVCQDTKADYLLDVLNQIDVAAEPMQVTIHDGSDWKVPNLSKAQWRGAFSYLYEHDVTPRVIASFASAAVLLLGVVLLIALLSGPENNEPTTVQVLPNLEREPAIGSVQVVATLTAERDAVWDRRPGEDLYANQRFTLIEGYAEITTGQGAVAVLEAPCTVELTDRKNALILHSGRLLGLCRTESSKGFVVQTHYAEVKDLGTEFAILAQPGKVTTTVFTGEVEMTPDGGETQSLIENQTAKLDTEVDAQALVVEDQVAAGFDTLRSRPALTPAQRWQEHLAELNRSHGLIGQLSFDANGVVATPGTGAKFDARLVGGTIVPGDEAHGTAASLLANGHDHGVNLTLDPALEHEQLTLITWINISRAPGQDQTTLAHPTSKSILRNSPSWQIIFNAPVLVIGRAGPEPNLTEAPLPDGWSNGWLCLASVLDTQAGTAAHYLNGQPLGSSVLQTTDRISFHMLRIGGIDSKRPRAPQRYLNGSLGLFVALDQALAPDQIQQCYQASNRLFSPAD